MYNILNSCATKHVHSYYTPNLQFVHSLVGDVYICTCNVYKYKSTQVTVHTCTSCIHMYMFMLCTCNIKLYRDAHHCSTLENPAITDTDTK